MKRSTLHTLMLTAIVGAVLLILYRHFMAASMVSQSPAMPSSQGLLGD